MNVRIINFVALLGMWFLGTGCSSTETLRDKYISADIRKAEELSKRSKKLERTISSHQYGYDALSL